MKSWRRRPGWRRAGAARPLCYEISVSRRGGGSREAFLTAVILAQSIKSRHCSLVWLHGLATSPNLKKYYPHWRVTLVSTSEAALDSEDVSFGAPPVFPYRRWFRQLSGCSHSGKGRNEVARVSRKRLRSPSSHHRKLLSRHKLPRGAGGNLASTRRIGSLSTSWGTRNIVQRVKSVLCSDVLCNLCVVFPACHDTFFNSFITRKLQVWNKFTSNRVSMSLDTLKKLRYCNTTHKNKKRKFKNQAT